MYFAVAAKHRMLHAIGSQAYKVDNKSPSVIVRDS